MKTSTDQEILARGEHAMLRIWRDESPSDGKTEAMRPYETLGYVVSGVVDVVVDGASKTVRAGETYVVPKNARHRYVVRETLTAVEAVAPAADAATPESD